MSSLLTDTVAFIEYILPRWVTAMEWSPPPPYLGWPSGNGNNSECLFAETLKRIPKKYQPGKALHEAFPLHSNHNRCPLHLACVCVCVCVCVAMWEFFPTFPHSLKSETEMVSTVIVSNRQWTPSMHVWPLNWWTVVMDNIQNKM